MPGIEIDGFRLAVNTRDERGHRPHVHVIKAGSKCKIVLDSYLETYDIVKMKKSDVAKARKLVVENFGKLMELWVKYNA
jgi:Domain of unknown function (DUF4160)